jgi:isoleucyl-tRNA synthetase
MMKNRPDWCVSRQRNWGVPMPLFIHKETGELHPRTAEFIETVAQKVEKIGIEAWFSLEASELLGTDTADYKKVTDTLDVWFDSGVTHACVLKQRPELAHPADLYLEGSDQHRGWFQSSLLTGCATDGYAPYRALLTHGFVVDGHGHKMSKSKGNVVAPQKVMDNYGADILRLWTASTDYSSELTISDEILKRVVESYRRIRNTLRFLLANLADFDTHQHALPMDQCLSIDRYAMVMLNEFQQEVLAHYQQYEFHHIVQKLHHFCSEDLGGFYLDILKDRLYTSAPDSVARRSAQHALFHITHALTRIMAPFLSFTAEEVWMLLNNDVHDSVFLQLWHDIPLPADSHSLNEQWTLIRETLAEVRKDLEPLRAAGEIGSSLQAEIEIYADASHYAALAGLGDDLRLAMITSSAELHLADTSVPRYVARASTHAKCERCWHYRADVGSIADHPSLCVRCHSNLFGAGEPRHHA